MKIEAGKRYKLRNGEIVQIFGKERLEGTHLHFWQGKREAKLYRCLEDGSYFHGGYVCDLDIVSPAQ